MVGNCPNIEKPVKINTDTIYHITNITYKI